jgi:hypothetical protein
VRLDQSSSAFPAAVAASIWSRTRLATGRVATLRGEAYGRQHDGDRSSHVLMLSHHDLVINVIRAAAKAVQGAMAAA